jgi:hypothetical protein
MYTLNHPNQEVREAFEAFDQINRKEYYQRYMAQRLPITLAGIAFNYKSKKLNITFIDKLL